MSMNEIDNSGVRETIAKILSSKTVPHAFLFVGQKGTGKTSVARIVAKTLNKIASIDEASADIVEMDAASNRGIDEIKNLIKEATYLPMTGKYRVFIIDEAHMITTEAFNALLKTLEEPPKTAIFILATTNLEKLPKTIVSRCSVVNFGRAKKADIIRMLSRIVTKEKINVDKDILELVTRHADHSFRDAAKILEELIIQKKLELKKAKEFLGVVGTRNILEIIATSDITEALAWIERFVKEGGNVRYLVESALEDLRLLLLAKHGVKTDEEPLSISLTPQKISLLIKSLTEAYNLMKISPVESLPLEIAVAEFYNSKHV